MTSRIVLGLLVALMSGSMAVAQVSAPAARPANSPPTAVRPGGVGDIQNLLAQLQQTAQSSTRDIANLRTDKWKTDGTTKGQVESNAQSLQRNLTAALPTIITQVRSAPDDVAASFKLYRNLGALYDVMASLTESAGAFGSKSEFQALASDLNSIDNLRRVLGDRLETLASIKEAEIVRLRNQIKTAQASAAAATPKKVIVDDTESKPAHKKTTKKKPASTTTTKTQSSTPPAQQTQPQ